MLTEDEARYVEAARAANTVRGYRADWTDFTTWCDTAGHTPLPADPATLTGYLTAPRRTRPQGRHHEPAAVGDHLRPRRARPARPHHRRPRPGRLGRHPPHPHHPTDPGHPADAAAAARRPRRLPRHPDLDHRRTRDPEPDLAGLRDRALLLVGFVTALRRSELAALDVDHLAEHPRGLVATIGRSKTNQTGAQPELVVIPHGDHPRRCPVTALRTWLDAADITDGPVFRPVSKGNHALNRRLHPESVNTLIRNAIHRTGTDASGYSAHSLRAGFVTHAHLRGATDRAIAHQTRHRSLATLGTYVRIHTAWDDNAATQLGL